MVTPRAERNVLQRLTRLAPRHPLHRFSVALTSLFALGWITLYTIAGSVTPVQGVKLRCVTPTRHDLSESISERSSAGAQPSILPQVSTWDVISWDLSHSDGAQALREMSEARQENPRDESDEEMSESREEMSAIYEQVIPMIRRARRDAAWRGRPLAVQLQGVSRSTLASLEAEMIARGGCWTSARLVHTPSWVRWLRTRGLDLNALLVGADRAAALADERALWTGIWGGAQVSSTSSTTITAERWALPAPPGRWPTRWFQPQPAALAVTISDADVKRQEIRESRENRENRENRESRGSIQLINLQLPAALHKHQSGALGLRALQRPPLSQRQGDRWLIMGDWQVQPDAHEAHPSAGFRFQRFSIKALHQDRSLTLLPTSQSSTEEWGRWRSRAKPRQPAIIDYALSSSGELKLHQLPQRAELWIGPLTQRAPLWVSWRPAQLNP